MDGTANVRSVEALDGLKGALPRFQSETLEALESAAREIQRTREWLDERLHFWQVEVRRREAIVAAASAAVSRCYDRAESMRVPASAMCAEPLAALALAQRRFSEAKAELDNVWQWRQRVEKAARDYEIQAQRLGALLQQDVPRGAALLGRQITILKDYLAMAAPSTVVLASNSAVPMFPAPPPEAAMVAAQPSADVGQGIAGAAGVLLGTVAGAALGASLGSSGTGSAGSLPRAADPEAEALFKLVEAKRAEVTAREAEEIARLEAQRAAQQAAMPPADPTHSGAEPADSAGAQPPGLGSGEAPRPLEREQSPESVEGFGPRLEREGEGGRG